MINALETIEIIGNNSLEAIHTLLTRTSQFEDIQQCFIAIKEIQKTTSLAIKIREKGLDPLKVCAIGADRFEGIAIMEDVAKGGPVLVDALAYLDCIVKQRLETTDHWIIYALVNHGNISNPSAKTAVHHRKVGTAY